MKRKYNIVIVLVACLAAAGLADPNTPAGGKLAVIPFEVFTVRSKAIDPPINPMSEQLCRYIQSQVDASRYPLYQERELAQALDKQQLKPGALNSNAEQAARFGRSIEVRYLLQGSLAKVGEKHHLSMRLLDCAGAKVVRRGWTPVDQLEQWPVKTRELIENMKLARPGPGQPGERPDGPVILENSDLMDSVNPTQPFKVTLETPEFKRVYAEGEFIEFNLTATADCYITLIALDPEGDMTQLYPNRLHQGQSLLKAGGKMMIPDPLDDFQIAIKPPHGEFLVRAIATRRPLLLTGVNSGNYTGNFKSINKGAKALVVVERKNNAPELKPGELHEILDNKSWTTAELTVVTFKAPE